MRSRMMMSDGLSADSVVPPGLGPAPRCPDDPEDAPTDKPKPFLKLHRRSGDRLGLYLAETKNRFVVSDGQRELFGLMGLLLTVLLFIVLMLLGKAFDVLPLLIVAGCLLPLMVVEVFFMKRLTTTLNRRTRRMEQETTRWLCVTTRNEFDLDDVLRVKKQGLGRQARIVAELSGGEEIALTYASVVASQDDLKTNGPNRMNNFLLRVRGRAKRKWPPTYVTARAARAVSEERREVELEFEEGETIKVLEVPESSGGWWKGKLASQKIGWFPASFGQEIAPSELAANNPIAGSDQ